LYGAAGSRGARYLLRNGLDYLGYQQYERALKFLRDAEAKEKELSASERQELKRGIERAQAGLRAAADAGGAPYALSDRSRRRNGFSPARPEPATAVAARGGADRRPEAATDVAPRTEWAGPVARGRGRPGRGDADARGGAASGAMARRDAGRQHAEDAPGEPIRLASAEGEVNPPARAGGPAPRTGPGASEAASAPPPIDPRSVKGEIPALDAPGLPNLTAVPASADASRPKAPQEGSAASPVAPSGAMPAPSDPARGAPEPAPATPTAPAADPAAPAPIPAESAPAPIPLETPDSAKGAARAPDAVPAPSAPAAPAVTAPEAAAAPEVSGPAATAESAPAPASSSSPKEAAPTSPAGPGLTAPEPSSAPAAASVSRATSDAVPLVALAALMLATLALLAVCRRRLTAAP